MLRTVCIGQFQFSRIYSLFLLIFFFFIFLKCSLCLEILIFVHSSRFYMLFHTKVSVGNLRKKCYILGYWSSFLLEINQKENYKYIKISLYTQTDTLSEIHSKSFLMCSLLGQILYIYLFHLVLKQGFNSSLPSDYI